MCLGTLASMWPGVGDSRWKSLLNTPNNAFMSLIDIPLGDAFGKILFHVEQTRLAGIALCPNLLPLVSRKSI